MTSVNASHTPVQPCGRNPPGPLVRLPIPSGSRGPTPATSARPTTMKTRMAETLTRLNQYSNSPNRLTFAVFTTTSTAETVVTHTHCGTVGKQNAAYMAIAANDAAIDRNA